MGDTQKPSKKIFPGYYVADYFLRGKMLAKYRRNLHLQFVTLQNQFGEQASPNSQSSDSDECGDSAPVFLSSHTPAKDSMSPANVNARIGAKLPVASKIIPVAIEATEIVWLFAFPLDRQRSQQGGARFLLKLLRFTKIKAKCYGNSCVMETSVL